MVVEEILFNEFWMIDEIGKTIFLTPEEAETIIKEREG